MTEDHDRMLTPAGRWLERIRKARKREEKWRKRCAKIEEIYRDEQKTQTHRINLLWANTELLKPACYAPGAQPRIGRRFKDKDPEARAASILLERNLISCLDTPGYNFDAEVDLCVLDALLTGRGVTKIRYVPFLSADGEDEQGKPMMSLLDEEVRAEHYHWRDFACSDGNHWRDVTWVAFRDYKTKAQLITLFGKEAKAAKMPYPESPSGSDAPDYRTSDDTSSAENSDKNSTAATWEIWDKRGARVIWVVEDNPDLMKADSPSINFSSFFPCPKPLTFLETGSTRTPVPEYTHYQSLANEVNEATVRINRLIRAIRARGVYNARVASLEQLLSSAETKLIPEENWNYVQGELSQAVAWFPNGPLVETLQALVSERANNMQLIYEITGISDLMRGVDDPNASATAQRQKSKYGAYRLKPRREAVERFVRDLFFLQAEVIAEIFSEETILARANARALAAEFGAEVFASEEQGAIALLREEAGRNLRIEVESSDTIAVDDGAERSDAMELLGVVSQFYSTMEGLLQNGALQPDAANAILMYALRRFRVTRTLEDALERSPLQPPQQPQQDPKAELEMAKLQLEREQMMANAQERAADRDVRTQELELRRQEGVQRIEIEQLKADVQRQKALASMRGAAGG